jgi:hypothetical protein
MAAVVDDYFHVAFCTQDLPAGFDTKNPAPGVVQLASDKFGFGPLDFNPTHTAGFFGRGKYGLTFEVKVKRGPALALAAKNHPDVLSISE